MQPCVREGGGCAACFALTAQQLGEAEGVQRRRQRQPFQLVCEGALRRPRPPPALDRRVAVLRHPRERQRQIAGAQRIERAVHFFSASRVTSPNAPGPEFNFM